ncbi:protein-disulfide reductase DsbD domain-containing protein [Flaviflagellibacter deserti]|uniref:Protein-disulfide reductase DsbD domain-containing protein n=1 Tax=Flaviflagellibacter deserti TaxID=2267266 RepID=A0ABV9YZ44_9HYPH
MINRRTVLTAAVAALFLFAPMEIVLAGAGVSPWAEDNGGKVRLVVGKPAADGSLRAGIEIRLEPGWKTYWSNPGASGMAPRFDWAGSENLAEVRVLWPVPKTFMDGKSEAAGYSGTVVLPVVIKPADAGKQVDLKLTLDFGLCKELCVPAHAELALPVSGSSPVDALAAAQVTGFESRVPTPVGVGQGGDLSFAKVDRDPAQPSLEVHVNHASGLEITELFADAGGAGQVQPLQADANAENIRRFRVSWRASAKPSFVDLVAVSGNRAIATRIALDGSSLTP